MKRKILICGLPGSGKTTLAEALAPMLGAVMFDGDAVRAMDHDDDFSIEGRVHQVRRMSWLCDQVIKSGGTAIAAFVCPTLPMRALFKADFQIFCDRIVAGRFQDTNELWETPYDADYTVPPEGSSYLHATRILQELQEEEDEETI
jgi:ABC-type cobalamin/Fe3+-siderophores transport system ATPase subunit